MNRKIARNVLIITIVAVVFVLLFFVIRIFAADVSLDEKNYLVVGIDDAGDNTDVMAVISIKNNDLSILQIPRDTYFNFGHYQNKINQYYSYRKSKSKNEKSAMGELAAAISQQLGIRLDGFVGIKTKSFSDIIDEIGGIDVELTRDINIVTGGKTLNFKRGLNKLGGKEALALVRHRASYKGGDLERLDVQRSVYRGLIRALVNASTNRKLISLVGKMYENLIVDISIKDAVTLLSMRRQIDSSQCKFNMLSGLALKDEHGIWYYALNRRENEKLLYSLYGVEYSKFDKEKLFLNSKNEDFIEIYNS